MIYGRCIWQRRFPIMSNETVCWVHSRAKLFVTPWTVTLQGSPVHGILQARILVWVAFSSPGDLTDLGIKPGSCTLQADSLPSEPPGKSTRTPRYSPYFWWQCCQHQVYSCGVSPPRNDNGSGTLFPHLPATPTPNPCSFQTARPVTQ